MFRFNVAVVACALVIAIRVPCPACAFVPTIATSRRTQRPSRLPPPPPPLTSRRTRSNVARGSEQGADDEGEVGETSGSDGGDGPVWSGGTYSWKPSEERRSRRRRRDGPLRTFDFAHCGTVRIRQRPEKLDLEGGARRTGVALWSAALAMAEYVDDRCGTGAWGGDAVAGGAGEGLTCLELGAGLGLPSAVAARHGLHVVATEGDREVLPLLRDNLASNLPGGSTVRAGSPDGAGADPADGSVDGAGRVWACELDWNEAAASDPGGDFHHPALAALERCGGRGADIILLSDVIYGATRPAWGALLSLLDRLREQRRRLLAVGDGDGGEANGDVGTTAAVVGADGTQAPGGTTDPLVLLGYTQRRRDMTAEEEGRFFALVRRAGMEAWPVPCDLVPSSRERILTTIFELRWVEGMA